MGHVVLLWNVVADICLICLVLGHDYSHYTWWYLTAAFISSLLILYGVFDRYYYIFMTIQVNVAVEVVALSIFGCGLFDETFVKLGWPMYFLGQFIMHFLFSVVVIWTYPMPTTKWTNLQLQCMLGYGIYVMWGTYYDPWEIYKCNNIPSMLKHSPFVVSGCMFFIFKYLQH